MKKQPVIIGTVLVLALGAGAYFFSHRTPQAPDHAPGEPQKNVEEILQERARQANTALDTPLGKAILAKKWDEANKLYLPDQQFDQLASIIRAIFIGNKINEFQGKDLELLTAFAIKTLDHMEEKNLHLATLLMTQLERLPSPKHDTENYKILKHWISDASTPKPKKRMAILKLALQDSSPDPIALTAFREGLVKGETYGATRADWIQLVDDTRNQKEQKNSAEYLLKNFKKIETKDQGAALVVLSHHSDLGAPEIRKITLQFFRSEHLPAFEASLRAIGNLLRENQLNQAEKDEIVKKLTVVPAPLQSPFVAAKSLELLSVLKHE